MEITAAMVKELRERTGSGMMECKKALTEAKGDIEAAVEIMRKAGMAKADKRAGRVAAEGRIVVARSQDGKSVAMVEVNCETDFVARGDDFIAFGNQVAQQALNKRPADMDALSQLPLQGDNGPSINEVRQELVAKIGENIGIRRFDILATQGVIGDYLHGTRIGVVVEMQGGDQALAKDIAMHVAASKPVCVKPEEVSPELISKEREIYMAQAAESGKPANIIEKMVEGRVTKFLREITLVGQPFVKNPDITVEKLLKDAGANVVRFVRYEVGEGIEKKTDNFVQEVMAQARGG